MFEIEIDPGFAAATEKPRGQLASKLSFVILEILEIPPPMF
jgi:hypothetical protein